jgi:hypothetical protein
MSTRPFSECSICRDKDCVVFTGGVTAGAFSGTQAILFLTIARKIF